MTTSPARLSEIAPANGDLMPMEDIKERDLILIAAEERETQFGRGYLLTLIDSARPAEEPYQCLTSGVVVVKQLDKVLEDPTALPLTVQFAKSGRAWIIV